MRHAHGINRRHVVSTIATVRDCCAGGIDEPINVREPVVTRRDWYRRAGAIPLRQAVDFVRIEYRIGAEEGYNSLFGIIALAILDNVLPDIERQFRPGAFAHVRAHFPCGFERHPVTRTEATHARCSPKVQHIGARIGLAIDAQRTGKRRGDWRFACPRLDPWTRAALQDGDNPIRDDLIRVWHLAAPSVLPAPWPASFASRRRAFYSIC